MSLQEEACLLPSPLNKVNLSWNTEVNFYQWMNANPDITQKVRVHFCSSLNGKKIAGGEYVQISFMRYELIGHCESKP